jgi:anti-sigma regulatory factor (Ser/Thr protein kinase)
MRIPGFNDLTGHGMNEPWPLQDFFELGALASAVPCARLHARHVLREWGLSSFNAELVVNELVANAVKASQALAEGSPVRLWLVPGPARILVTVWDPSPLPPARIDTGEQAEHGRGLMLVEAVCERWGWYRREDRDGKYVWAVV